MAIASQILQSLVPVLATATLLGGTSINRTAIILKNPSTNATTFFIGSGTVTATGATQDLPVEPGETVAFDCTKGMKVYAIAAAPGESVNIIEVG